jgi:hypothetical protein
MSILPQITYGKHGFEFFFLISMNTTKMKYLQTIEIQRMFLNVAKFSATNRSTKKIDFLKTFLPDTFMSNDYLITYC